MSAQLRSELLKLTTTRTTAQLVLAAAALSLLAVLLEGIPPTSAELAGQHAQRVVLSAVTTAPLFATLAGLIAVTSEFRYGTIRPTLVVQPRRRLVVGAKLVSAAATGVVAGAACSVVTFVAALVLFRLRATELQLTTEHLTGSALGPLFAGACGGAIGSAVGLIVRSQAGAIIGVLAYAFVVDAGLFDAAPEVGRFLPGKAGDALMGLPRDDLLQPLIGALILAGWTLIFAVVAGRRTEGIDV